MAADPGLLCKFYSYYNHANKETYDDLPAFENIREGLENEWLEKYPNNTHPLVQAKYDDMTVQQWQQLAAPLVQRTQQMFNHHIHPVDPITQLRKPLKGCLTKHDKVNCRGRYPRDKDVALCQHGAIVVCHGIAKILGLKTSGQRNMLGAVLAMRNEANLNGSAPDIVVR